MISARRGAGFTEAGLNRRGEVRAGGAMGFVSGGFGLSPLPGLPPSEGSMIVLTRDRQQIGIRSRGKRAPVAWDEARDAVRRKSLRRPPIGSAMG